MDKEGTFWSLLPRPLLVAAVVVAMLLAITLPLGVFLVLFGGA
jgi:hypothetical protein